MFWLLILALSIDELIPFLGLKENLSDLFSVDGVEHPVVSEDHSSSGLGCIERGLKVTHADLIAELQSKFNDDAGLDLLPTLITLQNLSTDINISMPCLRDLRAVM